MIPRRSRDRDPARTPRAVRLYGAVLRAAFPRDYPRELLEEAVRAFREAQADEGRWGRGYALRYGAWACAAAVRDGLAERASGLAPAATALLGGWGADFRFAVRQCVRRPGPSVVAVLALSVGVGANTALFSAVNAILLTPLPVPHPERLVRIFGPEARITLRSGLSAEAVVALHREASSLEGVVGVASFQAAADLGDVAELVRGELVTEDYFETLRISLARGRAFRPDEERMGGPLAAVLSHELWARSSGVEPGGTIRLNDRVVTVAGVAPPGFRGTHFASPVDLWVGLGGREAVLGPAAPHGAWLDVLARARPGVGHAEVAAEVSAVMAGLHRQHPEAYAPDGYFVLGERPGLINPARPVLVTLAGGLALAAALLILAVACWTVAGLAVARAAARRRELAVRAALGSGRARIVRQMLVESALLVAPASAAGLGVAWHADRLYGFLLPVLARLRVDFALDGRMLAFTALASLAAVLLAGTLPAVHATRGDLPGGALRGGRGEVGGGRLPVLEVLVVGQVAFAVVLLVAGGFFLRTAAWYRAADPGYRVDDRVVVTVDVGLHGLDDQRGRELFDDLQRSAAALPGVEGATLAVEVASGGRELRVEPPGGGDALAVRSNVVGTEYFETLGIPVVEGRGLEGDDRPDTRPAAVVNETLAALLWPDQSPVGRLLRFASGMEPAEVVGVAGDVKYGSLSEGPRPFLYLPLAQHPRDRLSLIVASATPPERLVAQLRSIVGELEPGLPLVRATTLAALVDEDRLLARAAAALGGALGALALFLAAVGLYGTLAFAVRRRRPELGLRMALGAAPSRVVGLVVRRGGVLAAWGVLLGLPLGLGLGLSAGGLLVGVHPLDPGVLGAVVVAVAVAVLAAVSLPAMAAARLDPLDALRD